MKVFLTLLCFLLLFPNRPHADALLGIYYGNQGWDMQGVRDVERWQGKQHAVVKLFTDWSPATKRNLFDQQLPALWNNGNVPIINWELYTDVHTPKDILTQIIEGKHDRYLQSWIRNLKRFLTGIDHVYGTSDDRRVYMQFAHEMNSNWYLWSGDATAYVRAWRYLHHMFTQQGLDSEHVQWIWCVNNVDKGKNKAELYYPGDYYVDWVGINGYNWGDQGNSHQWESVETVFDDMLQRMQKFKKPIVISEVSSASHVVGGRSLTKKARWVRHFFDYVQKNDVRMVIWFNEDKDADWAIFGGTYGMARYESRYSFYPAYREAVASSKLLGPAHSRESLIRNQHFYGDISQSVETVNLDVIARQYFAKPRQPDVIQTPVMPEADSDPYVQVSFEQKRQWPDGFCATVDLLALAPLNNWHMELALTGPVRGVWAAQHQRKKNDRVEIWPHAWNAFLRQNEHISFDFCAHGKMQDIVISSLESRPFRQTTYYQFPPLQIQQEFKSVWKGGYCVQFFLKNISEKTVVWDNLHLRLADSKLSSHWKGKFFANRHHLNIQPKHWNRKIKPGDQKRLGFCADGKSEVVIDKVVVH